MKGAVAIALNQSGILGATNAAKESIVKELGTITIPSPSPMTGIVVPNVESTTVCITITGGSFKTRTMSFTGLQQGTNGKLSISTTLSGSLMFKNWHERKVIAAMVDRPETSSSFDSSEFSVDFHSISAIVDVIVKLNQNYNLQPVVRDLRYTNQMFTFTLPEESELGKHNLFTCVNDKIKSVMEEVIPQMAPSITAKMQKGLDSVFTIIPNSGILTSDIMFTFPGTQQGLQFPSDNSGIQYRVLGGVIYKGKAAPGDIGVAPFPAIPTDRDAVVTMNDYVFNALFWAFYSKNSLNSSINATNVKFSPIMNTDYHTDSPLQKAFPNRYLIIDVELVASPTVTLLVTSNKKGEASINYTVNLIFWVAKEGSKTEKDKMAFSMSLTSTDVLDAFSISTNFKSGVQLLTFNVTTTKSINSHLLKSNVPGIDPKAFEPMWMSTLHPLYALVLDQAAQAGIPLPSVLNGIFIDYDIQICSGCASVGVNFESKSKYLHLLETRYGIEEDRKVYPNFSY